MGNEFKEAFASLYLSDRYNKNSKIILKIITKGNVVREMYSQFLNSLNKKNVDNCLMYLHLLVIYTKHSDEINDQLEQFINFEELTSLLQQQNLNDDD